MNQLRATVDVGGGIGRSSEIDRSKAPDLYFLELYWSSFLDFAKKNVTETKRLAISDFLIVFARENIQRPVTSSNRLGCHYEFGGQVRPENVDILWWGYDPPGKPEFPVFVTKLVSRKIGFSGVPGGSYPHHKKCTFPRRTFPKDS